MTNVYYINADPVLFGCELDGEAIEKANELAELASDQFPEIKFVVTMGYRRHQIDYDDILGDVQRFMNDNFSSF